MASHRIFGMLTVAVLLGLHLLPAVASDYPWTATCVKTKGFHDGDTLTCVSDPTNKGTFIVRFAGIDAPETGQAFWRVSRELLRRLAVAGTQASCYKRDRYGRQVCRLKAPDGSDIADAILAEGYAWHATKYANEQTSTERERYAILVTLATAGKKGLWSEPDPMSPDECRQLRLKHQRCR